MWVRLLRLAALQAEECVVMCGVPDCVCSTGCVCAVLV